ncbi:transportin-1 isoform X1 [Tanacetum coccineum]
MLWIDLLGIDIPVRVTSYHWERTHTMSNLGCCRIALSRSSFHLLIHLFPLLLDIRHFDVLYYLGHMFRPLDFFYVIHVDLIIGSRCLISAFHPVLLGRYTRLPEFLDVAAKQLNTPKLKETISAANNACWAIGELAIMGLNKSLIENSTITLGMLGSVCPELVSPHMEHYMLSWCIVFTYTLDMLSRERYPKFIDAIFLLPYLLSRGKVLSQSESITVEEDKG